MLRDRLKITVEGGLVRIGAARLARGLARSRALVLAYHNIVADDAPVVGDRALHLPRRGFAEQLDALLETHDIVPLDAILNPGDQTGRRPRVAITFDDAYRGAVTLGVEELRRRNLPATIFVAPALLGHQAFWWDTLRHSRRGSMTETFRDKAISTMAGKGPVVRARAPEYSHTEVPVPAHSVTATEAELRDAMARAAITLGSHSWSHPNLTQLADADRHDELRVSLRWLRERFERVVPWLAYPYGISSPAVEVAAREAGYVAALCVTGGWIPRRGVKRFALPRFNVPAGVSMHGFTLRTAGPLLA